MDSMVAANRNKTGICTTKTSSKADNIKQNLCEKCGRPLTSDEIAATKKLINRGTTTWFCTDCLAETFDVTAEDIRKKIAYFKEIGCTLFLQKEEPAHSTKRP